MILNQKLEGVRDFLSLQFRTLSELATRSGPESRFPFSKLIVWNRKKGRSVSLLLEQESSTQYENTSEVSKPVMRKVIKTRLGVVVIQSLKTATKYNCVYVSTQFTIGMDVIH